MIDRLNASLDFYANALGLRAKRQDVLASNVANADTPNYKARDFDFATALDNASVKHGQGVTTATTHTGHIAASGPAGAGVGQLAYRNPTQPSLDGNTVELNTERVEFMDNAVHYRADLKILGSQIKGLKAAMEPAR